MSDFKRYFSGYPEQIVTQVMQLIENDKHGAYLTKKYPSSHNITSDKSLYAYAI